MLCVLFPDTSSSSFENDWSISAYYDYYFYRLYNTSIFVVSFKFFFYLFNVCYYVNNNIILWYYTDIEKLCSKCNIVLNNIMKIVYKYYTQFLHFIFVHDFNIYQCIPTIKKNQNQIL